MSAVSIWTVSETVRGCSPRRFVFFPLSVSERSDQVENAPADFRILDLGEMPAQLNAIGRVQKLHEAIFPAAAIFRECERTACAFKIIEEILDGNLKNAGNLENPARSDPVNALFVFLDLLKSQSQRIGELVLAHAKEHPAKPHSRADMHVYRMW